MIRWFCNWMKHTFKDHCITLYDQHPELYISVLVTMGDEMSIDKLTMPQPERLTTREDIST